MTRGTLLWFNELRSVGVIETPDGDRLNVCGAAFAAGPPQGRCRGTVVEYELDATGTVVTGAGIVPAVAPRRARRRRG